MLILLNVKFIRIVDILSWPQLCFELILPIILNAVSCSNELNSKENAIFSFKNVFILMFLYWGLCTERVGPLFYKKELNHHNTFEHYTHKIKATSSRGQWVNLQIFNRTFVTYTHIYIYFSVVGNRFPLFENRTSFSVILTFKWYIYISANAHIVVANNIVLVDVLGPHNPRSSTTTNLTIFCFHACFTPYCIPQ